jgi:hypothetical protein
MTAADFRPGASAVEAGVVGTIEELLWSTDMLEITSEGMIVEVDEGGRVSVRVNVWCNTTVVRLGGGTTSAGGV